MCSCCGRANAVTFGEVVKEEQERVQVCKARTVRKVDEKGKGDRETWDGGYTKEMGARNGSQQGKPIATWILESGIQDGPLRTSPVE